MQLNKEMPVELGNIIYYCFSSEIDRIHLQNQGKPFDEKFADESGGKVYSFVVDYNYDYSLVPTAKIVKAGIPNGELTPKVQECINHYINFLTSNGYGKK